MEAPLEHKLIYPPQPKVEPATPEEPHIPATVEPETLTTPAPAAVGPENLASPTPAAAVEPETFAAPAPAAVEPEALITPAPPSEKREFDDFTHIMEPDEVRGEEREDERMMQLEEALHEMDEGEDATMRGGEGGERGGGEEEEEGGRKEFPCEYCSYSTNRRSDLSRHVRTHTGENLFHCEKCDYKTARKSDLRRHFLLHSGEKQFKCGVCHFTTTRKQVLLRHMKHHIANKYRCRVILVQMTKEGEKLINNNALADLAPDEPKKPRTPSGPVKVYHCEQCVFVSDSRKNYLEHRLTHGKEQKWKCPMCGYTTLRKSDVTRHFNIHIDNVFKCELCEYKTVRQSDFVRHGKTHTKPKYN